MTRVAVVTGAARGIGAATVRGLATVGMGGGCGGPGQRRPAAPLCHGHGEARLTSWRPRSRCVRRATSGPRPASSAHVADTTDPEALGAAVALAEERFGGLDAMVAVAGVIAGGVPLWEMPADQLGAVLGVDLGGPITAARVGIPALLRRPTPRQRTVPRRRLGGRHPGLRPSWPPTARPRPASPGWSAAWPSSWPGPGITANAVSPGSTATAMLDESARLYGLDRHPVRSPTSSPSGACSPRRRWPPRWCGWPVPAAAR